MPVRLRRSCLVVPASSPKMLAKAAELPADAVVVDLEDGVAVTDKEAARENLAQTKARAFGLKPVDGPYAVLADLGGLQAGARLALAHGFDGKWVIHPDQIEPVNAVFTPSAEEAERARQILAAADGVSSVGGEMVDA